MNRRQDFRILGDFAPEFLGLAFAGLGIIPQPGLSLEEESRLRCLKAFVVTAQQGSGDGFIADLEIGGEADARGEADQIEQIGHDGGFVEIVDAPDQAAVGVAPGSEVFRMQVADREHLRRIHQLGAPLSDFLRPAEIGCAQEYEGARFHLTVLVGNIFFDDVALVGQPGFVLIIIRAEGHGSTSRRLPATAIAAVAKSYLRMYRVGTAEIAILRRWYERGGADELRPRVIAGLRIVRSLTIPAGAFCGLPNRD